MKNRLNTQKITPFLWFDNGAAREAAKLYTSVFSSKGGSAPGGKDSKINSPETFSDTPSGEVEIITIELAGQQFTLMSAAGSQFKFNEAISFLIDCVDQDEVDYYWNALTADGGEESQCGWLKDKFGVSWQAVPRRLNELLGDSDKEKAGRVMQAMLQMKKIVVKDLEKAYEGK